MKWAHTKIVCGGGVRVCVCVRCVGGGGGQGILLYKQQFAKEQ